MVELHDASTPATIISRRAAFIREDGKIVDLDNADAGGIAFSRKNRGVAAWIESHDNG